MLDGLSSSSSSALSDHHTRTTSININKTKQHTHHCRCQCEQLHTNARQTSEHRVAPLPNTYITITRQHTTYRHTHAHTPTPRYMRSASRADKPRYSWCNETKRSSQYASDCTHTLCQLCHLWATLGTYLVTIGEQRLWQEPRQPSTRNGAWWKQRCIIVSKLALISTSLRLLLLLLPPPPLSPPLPRLLVVERLPNAQPWLQCTATIRPISIVVPSIIIVNIIPLRPPPPPPPTCKHDKRTTRASAYTCVTARRMYLKRHCNRRCRCPAHQLSTSSSSPPPLPPPPYQDPIQHLAKVCALATSALCLFRCQLPPSQQNKTKYISFRCLSNIYNTQHTLSHKHTSHNVINSGHCNRTTSANKNNKSVNVISNDTSNYNNNQRYFGFSINKHKRCQKFQYFVHSSTHLFTWII